MNKKELTYNQFKILTTIESTKDKLSQRDLSKICELSLGSVNKLVEELLNKKYIDENNSITTSGLDSLKPYKVQRAVFLAAGFGSRMVPVTLNTPKPLVRVHGKRIIETLLDAVVAADIKEIIIVRGYLKEQFNELLEKYPNITFIDNPVYNETNNISSAYYAREYMHNAYILESDLLLSNKRLIQKYEYSSNYLGKYMEKTNDWCFEYKKNKIVNFRQGGENCYNMYGISYYSEEDGQMLKNDLEETFIHRLGGKDQFWDAVGFIFYKEKYNFQVRACHEGDIVEIDSFNELKQIDKSYDC